MSKRAFVSASQSHWPALRIRPRVLPSVKAPPRAMTSDGVPWARTSPPGQTSRGQSSRSLGRAQTRTANRNGGFCWVNDLTAAATTTITNAWRAVSRPSEKRCLENGNGKAKPLGDRWGRVSRRPVLYAMQGTSDRLCWGSVQRPKRKKRRGGNTTSATETTISSRRGRECDLENVRSTAATAKDGFCSGNGWITRSRMTRKDGSCSENDPATKMQ